MFGAYTYNFILFNVILFRNDVYGTTVADLSLCDLISEYYMNGSNADWTCACGFPASLNLLTKIYSESCSF